MNRNARSPRSLVRALAPCFPIALLAVACGAEPMLASPGPDASADSVSASGDTDAAHAATESGSTFGRDAGLTPGIFMGTGSCLRFGAGCATDQDCCSGACTGGVCVYPQCAPDGAACTSNGDCCGQSCVAGACVALSATCATLGNACASGADCCSGYCPNGTCQASSFCQQPDDACSASGDCCTGACTITPPAMLGTCAASPPGGPANCGLADGMLCAGNGADGGAVFGDGGLPECGGPCCSRACAPWGPTGILVCQPASGCHVVGDLCTTDTDCCGASGLPGGSGKPVTCVITSPATVGVCRLPMGCKPDGDVCKLQTMSCNASCDCCSGNCETEDTCIQDNVGVPRCAGACVGAGQACASSANCCNGAPCVPAPAGSDAGAPYVCYPSQCVPSCGSCTTTADCCPGTSCIAPAGSTHGTCGPCGVPAGPGDGGPGSDGGGTPGDDGGTPPTDGGGGTPGVDGGSSCAQYGQICQAASDCCSGMPCNAGRCGVIVPIPR